MNKFFDQSFRSVFYVLRFCHLFWVYFIFLLLQARHCINVLFMLFLISIIKQLTHHAIKGDLWADLGPLPNLKPCCKHFMHFM